jgi:hypothetical protein
MPRKGGEVYALWHVEEGKHMLKPRKGGEVHVLFHVKEGKYMLYDK